MMRALLLLLLMCSAHAGASEILRVAVAANFRGTLEHINQRYQAQSGQEIRLSSASTGILASQLQHGAPFDLFFSADRAAPQQLLAAGIGRSAVCYARGQLALVGGGLEALNNPQLTLAIANPVTAPYGRAAEDVLARTAFSAGKPRQLVRGTNVLQAYQFWRAGAADLALVARSLAPEGSAVPHNWHRPLQQDMLVLRQSAAISAYLQWLRSDTVRQMIIEAGYQPCP
jgi:molybdate transport system substrate-binding protein